MKSVFKQVVVAVLIAVSFAAAAHAKSQNNLMKEDWRVAARGGVAGSFEGCDYDKPVPLDNGLVFVCKEYNYNYAYNPDFIVMERNGARKYLIDNEEYEGVLYSGGAVKTHVKGEFQGCEYDRLIPFDNGLIFECRTYHYYYAYRPEVIIINVGGTYRVTIHGKLYSGALLRRE